MEINEEIRKIADVIDYQLGDLAGNAEDAAKALYGLGYRQINEVRKKTAREILSEVFSPCNSIGGGLYDLTPKDKERLYKKYGVEVEECSDIHELKGVNGAIDIVKRAIMSNLAIKQGNQIDKKEFEYAKVMAAQLLYCICRHINEKYGTNYPINACDQLSCEKKLIEHYKIKLEDKKEYLTKAKEKTYCKYADLGMEGCECQAHHGNDWGYCEYKFEQHKCPYYEPAKEIEE